MAEVAEINPSKNVKLNDYDLITFVPMAAVDEVSGTIAAPVNRPYREVSKGFRHFCDEDAQYFPDCRRLIEAIATIRVAETDMAINRSQID